MHAGLDGCFATSAVLHFAAAHGGAAGTRMKHATPRNDIVTNRNAHLRNSVRARSHSRPATTYGIRKNDTYVRVTPASHHGEWPSLRCSCSQTVGTTPANIARSASTG